MRAMIGELNFEAEPFAFEFDAGEGELEAPAAAFTPQGVIDARIDVHAQYALLRLSKGDPGARADAAGMLSAVKAGRLGGIYKEDQQVPALQARRMGTNWWEVIRQGQDAALFAEPARPPLIVFRDRVRSDAARLDPALRKVWAQFAAASVRRCRIPPAAMQEAQRGASRLARSRRLSSDTAPPPQPAPKLVLWQNSRTQSHANYFNNNASQWARQIRAVTVTGADCNNAAVGATRFDSGSEINRALFEAFNCLGATPVTEVHVFSHSLPVLIRGRNSNNGLIIDDPAVPVDQATGGIRVSQLETSYLDPNVIFIFHGCSTGRGGRNIARNLFEYLDSKKKGGAPGPRVYGHYFSVCPGQLTDWCEYSRANPGGRILSTIPWYQPRFPICKPDPKP